MKRGMQCQQAATDLEGGEVCAQQDDTLAPVECGLQMLQSLDVREPFSSSRRCPPAHGHLQYANAHGDELPGEYPVAFAGGQFGKAQRQVDRSD
jgi:hypothetical protein